MRQLITYRKSRCHTIATKSGVLQLANQPKPSWLRTGNRGCRCPDDRRCVIRRYRFPFRASRSISAQATRCLNGAVTEEGKAHAPLRFRPKAICMARPSRGRASVDKWLSIRKNSNPAGQAAGGYYADHHTR